MNKSTRTAVLIIVLVILVGVAYSVFQSWGVNRDNPDLQGAEGTVQTQ